MIQFDLVLQRLGDLGLFQCYQYILLGISSINPGIHTLAGVFLMYVPDHSCWVPGLENLTTAERLQISAPYDESTQLHSSCRVYDVDFSQMNISSMLASNATFSFNRTRPCTSWVYEPSLYTNSVVKRWDLVCGNAWKRAVTQSIYMLGFLVGAILFGGLADRFGRKTMLMTSLLVLSVSGIGAAFVPVFWLHVWLRFVSGTGSAGSITCSFVLSMEVIGKARRMVPGICFQGWFAVGIMIASLVAYFVRDYRYLELIISFIPAACLLEYWFIGESPRWLLTQGRNKEAVREVRRAAKFNKVEYPADLMPAPTDTPLEEKLEEVGEQSPSKSSVLDLLKNPNLRWISLNIFFNWFVNSFVYYGLSMGVSDLAGSPFVNLCLFGALEFPGYAICVFTLDRVGRRVPLAALMVTGGLSCLAMLVVPNNMGWLQTTFAMLGKLTISGSFAHIYVYSAEIFPTVVRNVGVGAGSMHARVGGLSAPFVAELGKLVWWPLPGIIFGTSSLLAGLLALFLPETLNQALPDTIEDASRWRSHGVLCCKRSRSTSLEEEKKSTMALNGLKQNGEATIMMKGHTT